MGATKMSQLEENLNALEVVSKLTPEIEAEVERILENEPVQDLDWRYKF